MGAKKYQKAFGAYRPSVYRNGKNAAAWCSIGILYQAIRQFDDARDAYFRSVRLNPYIPEVWFNLGSLYETREDPITDAIEAYSRAVSLDANNQVYKARLGLLKSIQSGGGAMPAAPKPIDVNPTAYPPGQGGALPLDLEVSVQGQAADFKKPAKLAPVGPSELGNDVSVHATESPNADEGLPPGSLLSTVDENMVRSYRSAGVQTEPWCCNCGKCDGEDASESKSGLIV